MKRPPVLKGVFKENAVLGIVIGVCPVLAVTRTRQEGLAIGLAMVTELFLGNLTVGLFRKFCPGGFKIPFFMLSAALYVSLAELYLQHYHPVLSRHLGIFLPLLAVNCLVMWRMDQAADRTSLVRSAWDGLSYGAGFLIAILIVSLIREFFGTGTLFGWTILGPGFRDWPILFFTTPAGGFMTLGLLIALYRKFISGSKA
jgi:electron transport complex protein RnfE